MKVVPDFKKNGAKDKDWGVLQIVTVVEAIGMAELSSREPAHGQEGRKPAPRDMYV